MSKFKSYCVLSGAALSLSAASANASVLLYSFETSDTPNSVDGFARNGAGSTVTQSNIGVTAGANSGLFTVTTAGFAGDLTTVLPTAITQNSPAATAVSLDLTVPTGFTYAGGYADIGVTIFGTFPDSTSSTGTDAVQFQVVGASEQAIPFTTPGTTKTLTVPLVGYDPNPNGTGSGITYGAALSEGFVPTSFEFFFDKNAAITVAIDNVQAVGVGAVPEPASLGLVAVGGLTLLGRRRQRA